MKNKIPKILFIVSFLPYLLILLFGIISTFSGITFLFNTIYGFDAFIVSIFFIIYNFFFFIPIIPICLIYQICYLLKNKIKKFKNIKLKKYIKTCLIIGLLLILALMTYSYSFEIEQFIEKNYAKQMISNSEEQIGFNKKDIIVSGIFDMPEYKYSHILIDYDKVEVGMLLNASIDEFWKVKLEKINKDSSTYKHIVNDYFMQADVPLGSPGKRLISFYEDETLMHRTIAFLLIFEDGTIYGIDNIKEKDTGFTRFTGLHWSEFFVGENIKFNE